MWHMCSFRKYPYIVVNQWSTHIFCSENPLENYGVDPPPLLKFFRVRHRRRGSKVLPRIKSLETELEQSQANVHSLQVELNKSNTKCGEIEKNLSFIGKSVISLKTIWL